MSIESIITPSYFTYFRKIIDDDDFTEIEIIDFIYDAREKYNLDNEIYFNNLELTLLLYNEKIDVITF
uniref:Uncharacterized protein n=1 Tax=Pithovirus LCDPAC02 TaxID=2506601 RepID=A0A481YR73_9VIRU|nr:MAG: hypothetical protein LCDPAC02_01630 [Pithovirus LCDPAC02]